MQPSCARHLAPHPASGGPSGPLTLTPTYPACFSKEKNFLLQEFTDTVVLLPPSHQRGIPRECLCIAGCRCPTSSWGWPSCWKSSACHTTAEKQLVRALRRTRNSSIGELGAVPGFVNVCSYMCRWQASYEKRWTQKLAQMVQDGSKMGMERTGKVHISNIQHGKDNGVLMRPVWAAGFQLPWRKPCLGADGTEGLQTESSLKGWHLWCDTKMAVSSSPCF